MTTETTVDLSTVTPACSNREHHKDGEYRLIHLERWFAAKKVVARLVLCLACGRFWRSQAKYVDTLKVLQIDDLRGNRKVVDHLKRRLEWDDGKPYAQRPHWHVLIEEIDELAYCDAAYRKVADLLGKALGVPTTTEWTAVENRLRKVIDRGATKPAPKWTEDQLAYDGSAEPQKRELTPRERDILCRLLRDLKSGQAHAGLEELALFDGMRDALTPRTD